MRKIKVTGRANVEIGIAVRGVRELFSEPLDVSGTVIVTDTAGEAEVQSAANAFLQWQAILVGDRYDFSWIERACWITPPVLEELGPEPIYKTLERLGELSLINLDEYTVDGAV